MLPQPGHVSPHAIAPHVVAWSEYESISLGIYVRALIICNKFPQTLHLFLQFLQLFPLLFFLQETRVSGLTGDVNRFGKIAVCSYLMRVTDGKNYLSSRVLIT